ncbi:MAG: methylated-DNA-[protein]-cysteine S-methyltransferase [Reinekea sp.]|jgi:methylated-DNA-[protein]-cysteine S-methyltransferase
MQRTHCFMESPIGKITLLANEKGLFGVWFETHTTLAEDLGTYSNEHPILKDTMAQLTEYFSGQRHVFDLPLAATGTPFQQSVWQELREIPFGKSASYLELAKSIHNPKAVRAVGAANGKNPISIIVPCHRVIGATGKLTGYAGGLDRKMWLLKHEGCDAVS